MTGSVLFALGWKSALVSTLALLVSKAFSRRACSDRAAVLKFGVLCLLLLPLLTILVPATDVFVSPLSTAAPQNAAPAALPIHASEGPTFKVDVVGESIHLVYWVGVALVAAQLLAGVAVLLHWTAAAKEVDGSVRQNFVSMLAGRRRRPRALVSPHVRSPLSWGVLHPVILLDRKSLRDAASTEAVLAHELAHIRHGDWPALMAMRAAVAIFWFNPLVWLLARALEEQMERAADEAAAQNVGAEQYAGVLLRQADRDSAPAIPALAIASRRGRLSRRVLALLNRKMSPPQLTAREKFGGAAVGLSCVTAIASLVFAVAPAASARQAEVRSVRFPPTIDAFDKRSASHRQITDAPERHDTHFVWRSKSVAAPVPLRQSPRPEEQAPTRNETAEQQTAAQMERDAGTMDRQAAAVEAQARIVRDQASAAAMPSDAREQAERQADTLESAAAALRTSATGTRFNASALRRNEELESRLSQAP